ncbi:ABC transporter substrate-binding protein [Vibrio penaeicida]|uniref:ABC transporter substrate-binding protein n=1 Tax=Vibrio penaeicida TaxID=104609 RepID=UPI000CE9BDD8|nr:ABC transporter substrate-binding protein [Vibrio penaeicida]
MKKYTVLAISTALLASGTTNAEVMFKDSRGKEITLDNSPERVVAIASSAPIIYSAVTLQPQTIINITEKSQKSINNGLYSEFFPHFKTVQADAAKDKFVPNVEAILKNNPDIIFQWEYDPKLSEPLERVGLTVATWGCCSNTDRENTVRMSGEISGQVERANMIIDIARNSNKDLKDTLSSVTEKAYPSMIEIDKLGQDIRIVANNSTDHRIAGVNNVGHDDSAEWWKTINLEQMYIWNPSVIVIPAWAEELTPKDFYSNELLADIDAIQKKQVYKVPLFNRSPDASEAYLTMQWLAQIAHPNEFKASEFSNKVRNAYKTIYGVDITEEQYTQIMQMDQNKVSSGYETKFGLK